jgi:ribonuclease HI
VSWIDGIVRGGVVLASVYLWHSEGLTDRNLALLYAAGDAVIAHGGPWVLAGDFNMTPEELAVADTWLRRVGGRVFAPALPTCRSSGGGRAIDFFIVDQRIAHAVESVWTDLSMEASPHSAVILRLRSSATTELVKMLRTPCRFPTVRPIGCSQQPTSPSADVMLAVAVEPTTEALRAGFAHLISLAEKELCYLFGMVADDGVPDSRFLGRGEVLQAVWRRVVPPMARHTGRADAAARGLQWLGVRFSELHGLLRAVQRRTDAGELPTSQMLLQWGAITAKFRAPTGVLAALMADEEGKSWIWRVIAAGWTSIMDSSSQDIFKVWGAEARKAAARRCRARSEDASRAWWTWVDEQLRVGAGALHRMSKRVEATAPMPVTDADGASLAPQRMVEKARTDWHAIWTKFEGVADAPWRHLPDGWLDALPWAAELPPITGDVIGAAAKTFKERTGLGCDDFHPRWFAWLSAELLDGFAVLLTSLERQGMWPEQLQRILIALIPKSDGGRRPIGLLPSLVRVWERIRKPVVAQWRCSVERPYNWAAKGRSPQAAVWRQGLRAEAAAARGLDSAAVLVDLVKAFEMVRLELVWMAGLRLHFPPTVLRLTLESFAFARALVLSGAVADDVHTLSAILAGGSYATDALYMVLMGPCDELLLEHPRIGLCLFVDDLTIDTVGTVDEVAQVLPAAFRCCVSKLEDGLLLTVSRGRKRWRLDPSTKTVATASSSALSKLLEPSMRAVGVATRRRVKLLGIDYSSGKRVCRAVQRSRVQLVLGRQEGYKRLGKFAARHLVRTGAAPAVRYGANVLGVNKTTLKAVRRFACRVQGEMRGRCTFARLALARYDPGVSLATDPILDWARAVWDELVDTADLQITWQRALPAMSASRRPFSDLTGPAGAMVASALRIGWQIPSPFVFIDALGHLLDLRSVCPKVILQHAERDLARADAASSALAQRIGGPPDLEPLADFIGTKKLRRTKAAGSLRALGEGGWWTQSRLYEAGIDGVDDPYCRACLAADGSVRREGTLHHRFCGCPSTRSTRDAFKDQEIIGRAQSLLHGWKPLYQHGVPLLSEWPRTPRPISRWCGGLPPGADFTFTGVGFTDGAMRGRAPRCARRAGWAAILVDAAGAVVHGIYGPCPDVFPSSLRAELWAVLKMLELALPPLQIWVDNQGVVDGWMRGRRWCCSSARPAADLWRLIWDRLEDIGADGIRLSKCKGHATDGDVQAGRSTEFLRTGNGHADHFAGRGVDVAEHMSSSEGDRERYREARRWYAWLAVLADQWPDDMERPARNGHKAVRGSIELAAGWRVHAQLPHDLFEENGLLRCRSCPRFAALSAHRQHTRHFAGSECGGPLHDVALIVGEQAGQRGDEPHQLFVSGSVVWCKRCGCYGTSRLRGLKGSCRGPPRAGGRAVALRRLLGGTHPENKAPLPRALRLQLTR